MGIILTVVVFAIFSFWMQSILGGFLCAVAFVGITYILGLW